MVRFQYIAIHVLRFIVALILLLLSMQCCICLVFNFCIFFRLAVFFLSPLRLRPVHLDVQRRGLSMAARSRSRTPVNAHHSIDDWPHAAVAFDDRDGSRSRWRFNETQAMLEIVSEKITHLRSNLSALCHQADPYVQERRKNDLAVVALEQRRRAVVVSLARLGRENQRLSLTMEKVQQALRVFSQTEHLMMEVAEITKGLQEERRAVPQRLV